LLSPVGLQCGAPFFSLRPPRSIAWGRSLRPPHPFATFRAQRTFLVPIDPAEIDAGACGESQVDLGCAWRPHTAAFSSPRTRFARARLPLGPLLASLKSVAAVLRFRSGDQRLISRDAKPEGRAFSSGAERFASHGRDNCFAALNGALVSCCAGIDLYRAGASLELTVGGAARKSTGGSLRPRRLRPSWDGEFLSAPSPLGGQVGEVGPIFSVHR
jgi:hypothetical protein